MIQMTMTMSQDRAPEPEQAITYVVVRLMPSVEAGEFANVGIVAIAPEAPWLGFMLLRHRYQRITQFFRGLEGPVYQRIVQGLSEELERVQGLLADQHGANRKAFFQEVTRPRENMIRFSEPGVRLAPGLESGVKQLFACYVEPIPISGR